MSCNVISQLCFLLRHYQEVEREITVSGDRVNDEEMIEAKITTVVFFIEQENFHPRWLIMLQKMEKNYYP